MNLSSQRIRPVLIAAVFVVLAACQPTPQERMARADAYLAGADFRSASIELRNVLQVNPDDIDARLKLARSSYHLGDFADAANQFERALGLGDTDPDVWIGLGRALLSQGKAQEAFARVYPNLDPASRRESVLVFLGDVLLVLGNTNEAAVHYGDAVKINGSSAGGLIGEAMILDANNNDEDARRVFDYAEKLNPNSSLVWLARGNFLRSNREFSAAADAYAKSIELAGQFTPLGEQFSARVNLVSSLIDARRLDEAGVRFDELQTEYPGHAVSGFLSGRLAFSSGDYDAAQLAMQEYLSQNPRDARGEAILGAINFSQENLRQAELHLLRAVRANAGGNATRRLLAETQLRLNKPAEALQALAAGNPLNPNDFMYLALLGRAEIATGDTNAAIEHFEQSAAQSPENVAINLALAAAYLKGGRTSDSVDLLNAMPVESGSEFRRQSILIAALAEQGDRESAIAESDRLLRDNEGDAAAYVIAGALRQLLDEPNRAMSYFQQALDLEPDNLTALYSISRMAMSSGDLARAEQTLRQLLDAHPSYMPAIVLLGSILQRAGELDGLRPYLVKAIESAPEDLAPQIVLARLELALGRPNETLDIVNSTESRFPDEPELDHLKGLALLAKGENSAALPYLGRAASDAPDKAAYQFDLAQAQLANDRYIDAFETSRRFVQLRPQDARGPAMAIEAAIRAGLPDEAREVVDDFARNNPEHPEIGLFRGDLDFAAGDTPGAIGHYESAAARVWNRTVVIKLHRAYSSVGSNRSGEILERWLDEHPYDYDIRFLFAQNFEAQGDLERAVSEYEWLLVRGELNALGLNNLAWQYALAGNGEAIRLAEQAHELAPDNGSVTDTLGWILADSGDYDRAIPLLREAVTQAPENAEIRFHLASALADSGQEAEAATMLDELLRSGTQFASRLEAERLAGTL